MPEAPTIDGANTTWLLVSTALVLLMTPGLALFYGGLNRSKGVLNMMMMSFSAIGLVSILWWLVPLVMFARVVQLLLQGYGSYGANYPIGFNSNRMSSWTAA